MGILDPGAVTMSSAEYTEKINKGAYLSAVNGWQVMNKEAILDGIIPNKDEEARAYMFKIAAELMKDKETNG